MATVGIIAKLLETIITKVMDEDQLPELLKRRKLASLKEECRRALIDNDWDRLADATARLREYASKP